MNENISTEYPHIGAYRDMKPEIDAAIKKVKFLLGYQETYFAVQRDLRVALRRMTNDALIEKMQAEKNTAFLDEIKKSTPHKATIEKLIGDIDLFEAENKKLLSAIIKNGRLDSKEFAVIYPYLYTLAEDNTAHDRISPELVSFFGNNTKERCVLSSPEEYALFYYLFIGIKAKTRYGFAYPHIADGLVACIEGSKEMTPISRVNFYVQAGDYYVTAYQRDKAMSCFKNAALLAKEMGDLENSAYILQKYYKLNNLFPQPKQVKPDPDEIERDYGGYSKIVIDGINDKTMKVDPIEFTEKFAENIQDVLHKVEEEIERVGDLHTVLQRWQLMEEYFAKVQIKWKDPKQMNFKMMFD